MAWGASGIGEPEPDAGRAGGAVPAVRELREDFLLGYGYNTTRAYWGDLEHLNDWCMERGLDVLALSEQDMKKYLAWMRRRGYSGSTVRRRRSTYGLFRSSPSVSASAHRCVIDGGLRNQQQ